MIRPSISLLAILVALALFSTTSAFTSIPSFKVSASTNRVNAIYMSEADDDSVAVAEPEVRCPNCDKCDGSGRILGGIPLVLPWWPIKPYRPCPNFIANGGQYSRIGQPLDEIAFGRGGPIDVDEDDDF
mmetsp:Transcript_9525/g.14020  ORF Transcript_9525/g.14020 Transcript_9525/m.14020 type:complete len:129 (-) Transcript_9525:309-695(-)|eukprot:CAMPEP_0197242738 /NCGR_PEP_ID=MMETSP1429-20130617/8398_1 /TAXON_ID=49237 /ORGANISM="Chaetoceros  sp., Strain UNC1202" /LENGTH=128 /DNA_ID=CAMNT_0042702821 /DNA_START=61 /DNA_END=447 /DNA_ORIENTATION=-